MPTNPATPNAGPSVDRLALGIDSPRGSEPSHITGTGPVVWPQCFEAVPAGMCPWFAYCSCFESGDSDTAG